MKLPVEYALQFRPEKLKVRFEGDSDINNQYYSQALQDLFVLSCLNGKTEGTFLELGCDDPYRISNTYLLESRFKWKGVSVDINKNCELMFKESVRTCTLLIQDATALDFDSICTTLGTTHIDYLSLDLEPASITLKALKSIPFDRLSFSVITFEHDAYRFGDEARTPSREYLESKGYIRIVENVDNFEDWYINPAYVDVERVSALKRTGGHNSASDVVFFQ